MRILQIYYQNMIYLCNKKIKFKIKKIKSVYLIYQSLKAKNKIYQEQTNKNKHYYNNNKKN
jgi:hypothetical protein